MDSCILSLLNLLINLKLNHHQSMAEFAGIKVLPQPPPHLSDHRDEEGWIQEVARGQRYWSYGNNHADASPALSKRPIWTTVGNWCHSVIQNFWVDLTIPPGPSRKVTTKKWEVWCLRMKDRKLICQKKNILADTHPQFSLSLVSFHFIHSS